MHLKSLHFHFISFHILPERLTRCSAVAERPRCRVRYSFGQKWKTETVKQYFTDIIGLSATTVIWPQNLSNSVKKRKIRVITAFIQSHRGRHRCKKRFLRFFILITFFTFFNVFLFSQRFYK